MNHFLSVVLWLFFLGSNANAATEEEDLPTHIERGFRVLVVDETGQPAAGVPIRWLENIAVATPTEQMPFEYRRIVFDTLMSDAKGVVTIPLRRFATCTVAFDEQGISETTTWMLDTRTRSQGMYWDTSAAGNPSVSTLGEPRPGFDAVFQVLSRVGLPTMLRYSTRLAAVPCDGSAVPMRILVAKVDAGTEDPALADLNLRIERPDRTLLPESQALIGPPALVPWQVEGRTLWFSPLLSGDSLSADVSTRAWTQTIVVVPSEADRESEGNQRLRCWVMIPGETPRFGALHVHIGMSVGSRRIGEIMYRVRATLLLAQTSGTRMHHAFLDDFDMRWGDIAATADWEDVAPLVNAWRTAALLHPLVPGLRTVPELRYDTNPPLALGEVWSWRTPAVLLTPWPPLSSDQTPASGE